MWPFKRSRKTRHQVAEYAERVIEHVDAQDEEATAIVLRLERREQKNHFAQAMKKSMGAS